MGKGYIDDLHNLPQGRLYASVKTTAFFKVSSPFATAKTLYKAISYLDIPCPALRSGACLPRREVRWV